MRKIILKKKKKIRAYQWRKFKRRTLSAAAAVCILMGIPLLAHGNEKVDEKLQSPLEVVTEIYHKHEGSKEEQGGWF